MNFMGNLLTKNGDYEPSTHIRQYAQDILLHDHEIEQIFRKLENRRIPEKYPRAVYHNNYSSFVTTVLRNLYTERYGFPLVSMDWVRYLKDKIIKNGKCLEIMAGSGMLSFALRDLGVEVASTDNYDWTSKIEGYENWHRKPFTYVENIDAISAIEKYGKDVDFIIMSWPPYDEPIGNEVLLKMREINPNCKLIYIGEGYGGCTADDDFHNNAHMVKDADALLAIEHINMNLFKQFDGIHDEVCLVH